MSVDVLNHHDGIVHHHANGKGESRERDDVNGTTKGHEDDERSNDGNRNGNSDDSHRAKRTQEEKESEGRKNRSDENVAADQIDGVFNIGR